MSMPILVAGVVLGLPGCGEDVTGYESGELIVEWQVAPAGCEQGDVDQVEVVAEGAGQIRSKRFDCDRAAGAFESMSPGLYTVESTGYAAADRATHGSESREVVVRPDQRTEATGFELVARPARAEVEWSVHGSAGCQGDQQLELTVYAGGVDRVHRSAHDCEEAVAVVEGLRSGAHLFRIRGGPETSPLEGRADAEVSPGENRRVEVVLEPEAP